MSTFFTNPPVQRSLCKQGNSNFHRGPLSLVASLMGMTGTGKSSVSWFRVVISPSDLQGHQFIKLLTGNRDIKIGGGIDPETSEIQTFSFHHNHQYVVMVDTPGFDDNRPNMSDSKLLGDITNFLIKRYAFSLCLRNSCDNLFLTWKTREEDVAWFYLLPPHL